MFFRFFGVNLATIFKVFANVLYIGVAFPTPNDEISSLFFISLAASVAAISIVSSRTFLANAAFSISAFLIAAALASVSALSLAASLIAASFFSS